MAMNVSYVPDERTPLMTADAFRVLLQQSGFAVRSEQAEGDEVQLTMDGGVTLWLMMDDGFLVQVEGEVTFAGDRRSSRLLELIESMGWIAVEP